jgi:hypothetical protein
MAEEELFLFSETCQTICLKYSDLFLSSYPGKVIFGHPKYSGYLKLKSFQYQHNEFFNLYLGLIQIVQFFAGAKSDEKGLILSKTENINYFWIGKSVSENGKDGNKIVKFGIEYNLNIIYEIIMNMKQFNEFISVFSSLMLSCLCLKSSEREYIEAFANEVTLSNIVNFSNKRVRKEVFQKFKQSRNINSVHEQNIIDLLLHYNELIIIFKKIKSLNITEINDLKRIEVMLKQ